MKDKIKLALVQTDIVWESKKDNLSRYTRLIDKIETSPDIIVLPEMFLTGFSVNNISLAEGEDGITMQWMRKVSKRSNAVVTGSMIFSENNKVFNRLIWMCPSGEWQYYDKRHLFTLAGEDNHFNPGTERKIFNLHGWKILPLVCYDLRFPVWSRNSDDYDLLIYCANWPASRMFVWDILLAARAMENQSYVCGVNRVGIDINHVQHNGGSVIINPKGEKILSFRENEENISTCSISKKELEEFRKKFPVLKDRDKYQLMI